jgi:N-acetyl-gamma-glutamylphosphate reductase
METVNVAVVGGVGYAGSELVRYLLGHPWFRLVAVTSDSEAGRPLAEVYPALAERTGLVLVEHQTINAMTDLDAVFLAVPHTAGMEMVPRLLARGISVFDLSADFRLKDVAVYEKWYGVKHTAPELIAHSVYGLPEINRSLLYQKYQERTAAAFPVSTRGAAVDSLSGANFSAGINPSAGLSAGLSAGVSSGLSAGFSAGANYAPEMLSPFPANPSAEVDPVLVACPGCYPTASILAVAPALVMGFAADGPVIINAISGVSGAGRSLRHDTLFCSVNENVNAYGVATHRHTPEIAQAFAWETGRELPVVFTPHLAPLTRGLLSTVTLKIKPGVSASALENAFTAAYAEEAFVHLLPYGVMPRTSSVAGTNNAQVGIRLNEEAGVLIASCAIDNLGKGAASQAIQCANIVFGFEETSGLVTIPGLV